MKNITFVFNSHFTTSICNIENYFSQVCDNKENHKLLSKNESAKKNYDTRKQNFPCFSSRCMKFSASQMKELSTLFFTSELAKISHGSTASNQQVGKRPYASRFPDPPPCFPLLFSSLSFFFCFFWALYLHHCTIGTHFCVCADQTDWKASSGNYRMCDFIRTTIECSVWQLAING